MQRIIFSPTPIICFPVQMMFSLISYQQLEWTEALWESPPCYFFKASVCSTAS